MEKDLDAYNNLIRLLETEFKRILESFDDHAHSLRRQSEPKIDVSGSGYPERKAAHALSYFLR